MAATNKNTAVLEEILTALKLITSGSVYNYDYGLITRNRIDHSAMNDYPNIEIWQLPADDEILANRTYLRKLNIYIVVTKDTSSDVVTSIKEDTVSKMKQDVLNRLSIALVDQEFTIIEHMEPTREEDAIVGDDRIQGGISITFSFQHLYNAF